MNTNEDDIMPDINGRLSGIPDYVEWREKTAATVKGHVSYPPDMKIPGIGDGTFAGIGEDDGLERIAGIEWDHTHDQGDWGVYLDADGNEITPDFGTAKTPEETGTIENAGNYLQDVQQQHPDTPAEHHGGPIGNIEAYDKDEDELGLYETDNAEFLDLYARLEELMGPENEDAVNTWEVKHVPTGRKTHSFPLTRLQTRCNRA